jgi:hypothetical protein
MVEERPGLLVRTRRSQWLPEQQGMITLSEEVISNAHRTAREWE